MEAGDVDLVIKNPRHPYTRLLFDSIPWLDLSRRRGQTEDQAREADLSVVSVGCKFYSRCSYAMEKCKTPPPLFHLSEQQAASCYLFDEQPQIESEWLSELLPV
jgi:peptide/nickel transport system ATP-binding protein